MAEVVAFTLEVDGVELIFKNLADLKKFTKQVNKEFENTDKADASYKNLQKTLGALKTIQAQNRQETRNAGREFVIAADKGKGSYRALNAELVNLRDQFKNLSRADREGKIGQNLLVTIGKLDKELKDIDKSIGNFQRNVGNYKDALLGIGDVVSGGLLTGGIQQLAQELTKVFLDSVQAAREFEVAQKELQSITGVTTEGLEGLTNAALDISVKFGTAATDVLKGFQIIGSKKPELLDSAEALAEVTLQAEILAKASGLTLPEAADVLTKSLNQFGLGADDAASFTDILATSQQKGTATVVQLGEAFKNVGSVLEVSNLSFEEGNALLQALAKGGFEGAEAGTKLRGVLAELAKTNRDDLNPAVVGVEQVLDNLAQEIPDLSSAVNFFGKENAAAALTLVKQRDVVSNLNGTLNNYGSALSQATNNTSTTIASLDKLSASFDALVLSISQGDSIFSKFTQRLLRGSINLLEGFRQLNEGINLLEFGSAFDEVGRIGIEIRKLAEQDFAEPADKLANSVAIIKLQIQAATIALGDLTEGSKKYNETAAQIEVLNGRLIERQGQLTESTTALRSEQALLVNTYIDAGQTVQEVAEVTGLSVAKVNELIVKGAEETTEVVKTLTDEQKTQIKQAEANIEALNNEINKLGGFNEEEQIANLEEKSEKLINALTGTPEQIRTQTALLQKVLELELAKLAKTTLEAALKAEREDFSVVSTLLSTKDDGTIPKEVKQTVEGLLEGLSTEITDREEEVAAIGASLSASLAEGFTSAEGGNPLEEFVDNLFGGDAFASLLEEGTGTAAFGELIQTLIGEGDVEEKLLGTFSALSTGLDSLQEASQRRLANETKGIEERYDREIKLAKGNKQKIATLEKQKDAEIKKVEKEAFERAKRIQIAQAGLSLASGIVNVFAAPTTIPDPFGAIYKATQVGILVATFAAQVAKIGSQKFAKGGYTGLGSGRPDETGHKPAGIVHAGEYVVPKKVLAGKEGAELVSKLEKLRKGFPSSDYYRSKGFYVDGGIVNTQLDPKIPIQSVQVINNVVSTEASFSDEQLEQLGNIIETSTKTGVMDGLIEAEEEILAISDRVTRLENTVN